MQMSISFNVHRNHLRTGFDELFSVTTGLRNHQVSIDRQTSCCHERLHNWEPDRDVWYEMTVHHIDVKNGRATTFDSLDLFSETRKIRGQDRRCNVNFPVIEHSLDR